MSPDPSSPSGPNPVVWTPERVARFWNNISQTDLTAVSFAKVGGRAFIVAASHLLPKDGRILDFGAGDGTLAKLMCERGLNVACYEPSAERSKTLTASLSGTNGFLGNIDEGSTDTFDVVILTEVIEHILDDDMDVTLKRLHSLTKPGGTIIITTPINEKLEQSHCLCPMCAALFHRWQHVRSFTAESLDNLLSTHGFANVATHKLDFADRLFLPHDVLWGTAKPSDRVPFYLYEIRNNRPAETADQTTYMYVGKRA